jgi:hypothetical protein
MMRLAESPLFTEYMERAAAANFTSVVEGLMVKRFGSLDAELARTVPNVIKLSPLEFTSLLVDLSRQELIDRFTEPN